MPSPDFNFDVVILGGGFAGVYCAQSLERALGRNSGRRVALVAGENYMVFQPMLAEVAGSTLSPRHVVNPLRLLCRRTGILKGTVEAIDWPARSLRLFAGPMAGHVTVRYEHLVVALGAVIDLSRIPGMPEHAFLMQNVGDAMLLRTTVLSRLEEANLETDDETRRRLLSFVVVGGGYSGVETAGQILDFVREAIKLYDRLDPRELRVALVHSRDVLLPTITRPLGEYTARVLLRRGLDLRLNTRVQAVTATQVRLGDGTTIDAATVVSTVGNAPHPRVLELIEQNQLEHEGGRIVVGENLRTPTEPHLWSAGDCAAVPFVKGGYCPQTAQFAYRQGRLLGRNLAAVLRERPLKPFRFPGLGELASIGHHTAVANIAGMNFSGFIAWFMWRTIYLMKLPRLERKLRVMIDWTLDLFFPRDLTQLSPRYSKVLKEIHLEPGDVLFHAGEPAYSLYVVRSGAVELRDRQGVVSTQRKGDYFGERALLADGNWMFTARATEATQLISIPALVFKQIVGSGGSLGRFFEKSARRYQSRAVIDALVRQVPEPVQDQPVSALMQTDLITLRPDQTIASALATVRDHPHSSYPLVNSDGKYAGVLLREDFQDFLRNSSRIVETPLSAIGTAAGPTVTATMPVREAIERLVRSGANKLVVIDHEQRLSGIVTVMDFAAAAATEVPSSK